jgi:hypothetical protein
MFFCLLEGIGSTGSSSVDEVMEDSDEQNN